METVVEPRPPDDPNLPPEPPSRPRQKPRVWLALLPAFLITTGMMTWSFLRFAGIQPALGISPASDSRAGACAQVYGVNLYNSEDYVRESSPGSGFANPQADREFSTVLTGMVENTCDEPLKRVRISIKVRDKAGARGSGEAIVSNLDPGEAKAFERAWVGQIESYEIAKIH